MTISYTNTASQPTILRFLGLHKLENEIYLLDLSDFNHSQYDAPVVIYANWMTPKTIEDEKVKLELKPPNSIFFPPRCNGREMDAQGCPREIID